MIHFDFEFLLVLMTLLTGLVWLIDHFTFAPKRARAAASKHQEPLLVEYSKAFFPVLFAVLILRAFLFEPFRIPSGSMMPSLLVGDFIVVNKFAYGLRLPVTYTKITEGSAPKRGDVAVFRFPNDQSQDYIKRIIGLPGDHVSYYNRRLAINGEMLKTSNQGAYAGLGDLNGMVGGSGCDRQGARCEVMAEQSDDSIYQVMTNPNSTYSVNGEVFVPEGQFFVMGDNRDHSNDSRIWGFVPEENLVGRAEYIWLHYDWRSNGTGFQLSRIGNEITQ